MSERGDESSVLTSLPLLDAISAGDGAYLLVLPHSIFTFSSSLSLLTLFIYYCLHI